MTAKHPFIIGLTGSVGMGKSTTAKMFADAGAAHWDADAAVARLYAKGGAAVREMASLYPDAVRQGAINKAALKDWISRDSAALAQIEKLVHPLVVNDRHEFLESNRADIVVLDIPLLFETGAQGGMDMVVVVSAPPDVQKTRVLARVGMTKDQFDLILSKQMPDAEKRALADVVIFTESLEETRNNVQKLMADIQEKQQHA